MYRIYHTYECTHISSATVVTPEGMVAEDYWVHMNLCMPVAIRYFPIAVDQ